MTQDLTIPFLIGDYVSVVTGLISSKYDLPEEVAMRRFLFSETYRMLSNPKLEMWEFCPDVIFEIWECEQITGDPRHSAYLRGA